MASPGFARTSTGVTINVNEGGPVAAGDVVTVVVRIGEGVGVRKGVPILSDPGTGVDTTSGGLGVPGSVSDPSTDSERDVVSYLDISGEVSLTRMSDSTILPLNIRLPSWIQEVARNIVPK